MNINQINDKKMKTKLKLLALRLKKYKAYYSDGHLERQLASQEETIMHTVGDMLMEIINASEETTDEELIEELKTRKAEHGY